MVDRMLHWDPASDSQPRDRVSGKFEERKDGTWLRQRKGRSEEADS
jgi:hypothetical protein